MSYQIQDNFSPQMSLLQSEFNNEQLDIYNFNCDGET